MSYTRPSCQCSRRTCRRAELRRRRNAHHRPFDLGVLLAHRHHRVGVVRLLRVDLVDLVEHDEHGGDAVRVLLRNTRVVDDLVQARRGVSLVALKELDEHLAREAADGGLVGRQVDEGLGDVAAIEGRAGRLWRVDVGAVIDFVRS